ncbi:hypothetical protein D3H55_05080 [Bacillus salacetis]|uniref:DUF2268 domain-containing protein n=1 Tax=Bacillus salacetis TaxID=2315464 RepID=A0A3A1R8W5_9BACI|nr:DUF2268 domain-containing putative Zn-dependent protease [Bacillus salacetis]RIW37410.1 hypothetical protein D3H55_05080 [Bacillus salacetis]
MKQKLRTIVGLLLLLMTAACSHEEEDLPSQKKVEFEEGGQQFTIVPLYEEFLDYSKNAEENPELNNKGELFTKVIQPFQSYMNEEDASLSGGMDYTPYFYPTRKAEAIKENTAELLERQDEINEIIKSALVKSAGKLSGDKKTIVVRPADPDDSSVSSYLNGAGAVTISKDVILLMLAPEFEKEMLEYVVAHEYHHSIFLEVDPKGVNLLNSIVFEGKAESFAVSVFPGVAAPWTEPMEPEEEKAVLEYLRNNKDSTSSEIYFEFQEGSFKKGIPMWANYKMGFKITESFLKNHPEVPVGEWTTMTGDEIVRGSDYPDLLENEIQSREE